MYATQARLRSLSIVKRIYSRRTEEQKTKTRIEFQYVRGGQKGPRDVDAVGGTGIGLFASICFVALTHFHNRLRISFLTGLTFPRSQA